MASAFGAVCQAGCLVRELTPALETRSARRGVGPFFILPPRRFDTLCANGTETADHNIIAEVALRYLIEVFGRIKQASIGWDGSDPIRRP